MKLAFQEFGDGPPVIILHGLFGSSDNWQTVSRNIASRFKVFALDLRNHGRSPHSPVFSYEAMAHDLLEFLRDRNLHQVRLIGHSLGGKTAMRFALDNPDHVTRLVIVDIAPKEYPSHHDSILDALTALDLGRFSGRKEIDTALSQSIPSATTRQFLLKNLRRTDQNAFEWRMNLPVLHEQYDETNKAVTGPPFPGPALFLRSLTSGYINDDDLPEIRRLFPRSRIAEFPTGHWIHADAPAQFVEVVLDFLLQPA